MVSAISLGIGVLLGIVVCCIIFYLFVFKRDPKRTIPPDNCIVSPTDGKVVQIFSTDDPLVTIPKGLVGKIKTLCSDVDSHCTLISIMMTPLNVHYQRAPIQGKIVKTKHYPGKFKNAVKHVDLDILENEHNEILIKNKQLTVKVIQIAGFLARRINCFVKESDKVDKGQKIGFIDLGSQVTFILPKSCKITVKRGQYVKGGETIIGYPGTH